VTVFEPDVLPFGVFSYGDREPRVGTAVGDQVIDLARLAADHRPELAEAFARPSLNDFLALGRPVWQRTREWLLGGPDVKPYLVPQSEVRMRMPFEVADYVDFYASEQHATNLGRLFRPGSEPLLPNWKHLPVGYHGRAGTVVVSGTEIVRPSGQRKPPDESVPVFGPSQRLDIEVELGFVVGAPSALGRPIPVEDFAEHVFGVVLVNDWSARDLQAWEYVPLGPFLGKSFATSVSPWVVPLDALAGSAVPLGPQDPPVLPYLAGEKLTNYDIAFEVSWNGETVSRPSYGEMYWSPSQMLAHLTVNGASARTGDLFASGTVSGPEPGQRGSLVELTWGGKEPVTIAGAQRTFLEDGDEITITGWANRPDGGRFALGEVTGRIAPAWAG
jgi:fumarylacetoacetase